MKKGGKYRFEILEVNIDQKTTVISDLNGHTYIVRGEHGIVGDTVELIVANIKQEGNNSKYYFSQEISNDGKYRFSGLYTLKIVNIVFEGKFKVLECRDRDRNFKIRIPSSFEYFEGDSILCRPNWILGNDIDFYVITLDQNHVFEVDDEYMMTVKYVEKDLRHVFIHSSVKVDEREYETRIICSPWVFHVKDKINNVLAKYLGDGKWELNYSKISCPLYDMGKEYSITLEKELNEGFYLGKTKDGIEVRVLQPFSIVEHEFLRKDFKYQYNGLDNKGYLLFRQKLVFSDIIESKALKVIAFDNIRSEYKNNSEVYDKLFNDYDSKNNLWVLSYGNALFSVIDDKVRNNQWDTAFLISEVLEKIEHWIIESGYLKSFSLTQRETIKNNAVSYLREVDVLSKAISIIIEHDFDRLITSLRKQLNSNSFDISIIKIGLSTASKVFELCSELPSKTIELLNLICNSLILKNIDCSASLNRLINSVVRYQDSLQREIYSQVFINPGNQAKYFNSKEGIKTCILLLIWIVKLSNRSGQQLFQLMLFRHLAFYHPDINAKEKFILSAIKVLTSQQPIYNDLFNKYNLVEDDILDIVREIGDSSHSRMIESNTKPQSSSLVKVDQYNSFGYIFRSDDVTFFLPFKEKNTKLKKGEEVNVEVVAFEPISKLGLVTQSYQKTVLKQDGLDIRAGVGNVVKGIIKNVVDFGIFVNLGERDGLLHSSNVSHSTTDLKKIFTVGDEITVRVLSIDDGKIELDRISVLNELSQEIKFRNGDKATGTVFRIDESHGIFLELDNGANGYINKNNVFFNNRPKLLSNCFVIGEVLTATVIRYDRKKGYELSIKQNFEKNPIGSLVIKGNEYDAKVILVNDIKQQVGQRLGIEDISSWSPSEYYCPKCQRENYSKEKEVQSFLEISNNNNKNWQCLWCDYKSSEQLVVKLLDFPVIGYFPTDHLMIEDIKRLVGQEFTVKVEEITKGSFVRVDILNIEHEIEARPKDISLSKRASAEMGFVYEQFAFTSSDYKEDLINLCKYFFGFSGMARSYFHSFFNEYSGFINQISNFSVSDRSILSSKASDLVEYFSSETKAIESFPILTHIINSLKIMSLLKDDEADTLEKYIFLAKENKDSIELVETINLAISFTCMPDKYLREDIWELLLFSFKNYLFLIEENELDKEIVELRKRIRNIIGGNIEDELIECKGSFLIPIPSKSDLVKLKSLENKLHSTSSTEEKDKLKDEILKLKNPSVTKEKKEIVTISWVKTIAAFANTNGGELLIGVGENEKGDLVLNGIEKDLKFFKNEDNMLLSFDSQFEKFIGNEFQRLVKLKLVRMHGDKKVLHVSVAKSDIPVFVRYRNEEQFFIRRNVSTIKLTMREFSDYKDMRFVR